MYKAPQLWTTFGSCDVEKVHAVVAAKHISKSKCTKHTSCRTTFGLVAMSKKCTPLWREAHFEVKMYKTHQLRTTFWKLRCRKSARRCGAKHISKSKCTKHTHASRPLLEVQISKKCTPLWREAHFEVKMYKTLGVRIHFWRFRCRFASLRVITLLYIHSTTLQYITLHYTPLHNTTTTTTEIHNYTPLHSATLYKLQYTTPHYTTLHSTTLHYITQHYTPLHYTTLHYTTLYTPHTTVHYTTLHSTTLQLQLQNYTTTLHYTPLHTATLNYTTLHYTTLHYTTLERSIDR